MTPFTRNLPFVAAAVLALGCAGAASAQTDVRCYGVSLAGQNDGLDQAEAPRTSKVDYQGNAWVMLPQAQCLRMALPVQTDGTPRRGATQPLSRDLPGS